MQDRFRFRVWYKSYGEIKPKMLYDAEQIYDYMYGTPETIPASCFGSVLNNEDEYIVMQCTGLKDKNGKLIYEGDIVEAKQKPDREGWYCVYRGIVKYDNKNCQYVINSNQHKVLNENKLIKSALNTDTSFNWFDWFEIIGNIYENKELLEEINENK